ncbi:MAG: vWA domain-containing protein [Acidobacteriota bacterium]|nr:vWA domain-containing protein [Acidobacteriota bacterium]
MPWSELVAFLDGGVRELFETDFAQIRYGDIGMAVGLAIVVSVVLLVTLLRLGATRKRHARAHSGHDIALAHQKRLWIRILHTSPKALLAGALTMLIVSVADPFLTATEEVSGYVESRVRIDLVDTSGSMAWEFPDTNKSKAEVARDAHLEFLNMRRDKNDRVSLWLFSTYPYMVDDFVMDDELYYYQVWDAPYVMTQRLDKAMVVPRDKVRIIPAEGDTNIIRPLQDIVKHFDRDEAAVGRGNNQNRAVLIITDAAVDEFPDAEFAELNRRNIVPYIIYINTSDARTASFLHPTVPQLVGQIQEYGGDYFDVTDEDSLARAYQAIDEREAVRMELKHRALKVPIYSRFLLVAMGLLVIGIPVGFVSELLWGTSP